MSIFYKEQRVICINRGIFNAEVVPIGTIGVVSIVGSRLIEVRFDPPIKDTNGCLQSSLIVSRTCWMPLPPCAFLEVKEIIPYNTHYTLDDIWKELVG